MILHKIIVFVVLFFCIPVLANAQDGVDVLAKCKIKNIQRPLVFIPGIMGSQLYNIDSNGVGILIWPPYLNEHSSFKQLLDKDERFVNYSTDGLFPVVYGSLIYNLRLMGYDDENLWVFPYDWTKSCEDAGKKLVDFLKNRIARYQKLHFCNLNEVDIVCHSMGGIVARKAYQILQKEADSNVKIHRIAYIASPHFGSPKAYFTLHPKIDYIFFELQSFEKWAVEFFWKNKSKPGDLDSLFQGLKDLSNKLPSLYELLPDKFYFEKGREFLLEGVAAASLIFQEN